MLFAKANPFQSALASPSIDCSFPAHLSAVLESSKRGEEAEYQLDLLSRERDNFKHLGDRPLVQNPLTSDPTMLRSMVVLLDMTDSHIVETATVHRTYSAQISRENATQTMKRAVQLLETLGCSPEEQFIAKLPQRALAKLELVLSPPLRHSRRSPERPASITSGPSVIAEMVFKTGGGTNAYFARLSGMNMEVVNTIERFTGQTRGVEVGDVVVRHRGCSASRWRSGNS